MAASCLNSKDSTSTTFKQQLQYYQEQKKKRLNEHEKQNS